METADCRIVVRGESTEDVEAQLRSDGSDMFSSEAEYHGYSTEWDVIYKAETNLFAARAAIVSHPDNSGNTAFIPSEAIGFTT